MRCCATTPRVWPACTAGVRAVEAPEEAVRYPIRLVQQARGAWQGLQFERLRERRGGAACGALRRRRVLHRARCVGRRQFVVHPRRRRRPTHSVHGKQRARGTVHGDGAQGRESGAAAQRVERGFRRGPPRFGVHASALFERRGPERDGRAGRVHRRRAHARGADVDPGRDALGHAAGSFSRGARQWRRRKAGGRTRPIPPPGPMRPRRRRAARSRV